MRGHEHTQNTLKIQQYSSEPVIVRVFSGLWRERPAGPYGGPEEHVHRDAVLDGPGGHRL